jgi:hypothetical protein
VLQAFQPTDGPRRQRAPRAKRARAGAGVARVYWCAECRTPVASESDCIDVGGAYEHTFTNPAGVRFTIGCFRAARGCRVDGEPTLEFTWFAGYAWSYAACTNCGVHLGWYFEAEGARFFGLILARLLGPI